LPNRRWWGRIGVCEVSIEHPLFGLRESYSLSLSGVVL